MGAAQALSGEPTLRPGVQRRRSPRRTQVEGVVSGSVIATPSPVMRSRSGRWRCRSTPSFPTCTSSTAPGAAGLAANQAVEPKPKRLFKQLRLKRLLQPNPRWPRIVSRGWGTSPSAVLRSKRSSKNLCTVRRGVLVGKSQTGDIYVGNGAPWSGTLSLLICRWSRVCKSKRRGGGPAKTARCSTSRRPSLTRSHPSSSKTSDWRGPATSATR
jgi:hypothetical protein